MRIATTGSIATDHLMVYPGRFADHLLSGHLKTVSLSFLADELNIRRGGAAANIAVGLGRLGLAPLLAGAVGADFAEYRAWLHANGVRTDLVLVSDTLHTARFVCTTDREQNQIATFYAGAMSASRSISLEGAARGDGLDLVVVSPNDPEAMLRHTRECRELGVPFAADPSQQLARINDAQTRELVDGARLLFTNAYEAALLGKLTGWSPQDVLDRVGTWVVTMGAAGVSIRRAGSPELRVPAVPTADIADPTGVGDAFRAGFLAGTAWRWPVERSAQLGCSLASVVLESVGTQEYRLSATDLLERVDRGYGPAAAAAMAPRLRACPYAVPAG